MDATKVGPAYLAPAAAPAGPSVPSVPAGVISSRGNGLEYAQMRKEKAREEYKEKRRQELLMSGDVERTKRRKKNDTSMTENQKYHRRLKMNQDSAAAARYAQDIYINTLENLVEVTESEKSVLSIQASNLKSERDDLMRRVDQLQSQLQSSGRGVGDKMVNQAQMEIKAYFDIMNTLTPAEMRSGAVQPARAV